MPGLPARVWRKLWVTLRGEASWIEAHGSLRDKEHHGLLRRANYAYGLLRAADVAAYFGHKKVTVCEFGVASGAGLMNMISLADLFTRETGVEYRIVGFDTGEGLPQVKGHKDHAEIWVDGDFEMENREALERRIAGKAELIFGDIEDTIDAFTETLAPDSPLGFVSIDVDIYSGTKSALRCMSGPPDRYNPAVSFYFDDVSFFFANQWCGELLAIDEFNEENKHRKLGVDRSAMERLQSTHMPWCNKMYVCHILDHEDRNIPRQRSGLTITDHLAYTQSHFLR